MKKLPLSLRCLICITLLLLPQLKSYASHILGTELTYTNVTGNTYKLTMTIYGSCSPSSAPAFSTLPYASPQICIYDGSTYVMSANLTIQSPDSGIEVTSLCAGDTSQCTNTTSTKPGVMKFVYSGTITLPHTSATWRFIYNGSNGTASAAGRAASITNISGSGGTIMQIIDTLNNSTVTGNNSAVFNVFPPLYYLINQYESYDPNTVDPDADSLVFSLVSATNGTEVCGSIGGAVTYYSASAWPGQPLSAATPLQVTAGSFYLNPTNGLLSFVPNVFQSADIVYSVREFRGGVFVGSTQHELIIGVSSDSSSTCTGTPDAGTTVATYDCIGNKYILSLSGYSCAGVTLQWQSSPDEITWTNVTGADSASYSFNTGTSLYYRCAVNCIASGIVAFSAPAFIHGYSGVGINSLVVINADTVCNGPEFYVGICSVSPAYSVVSYYGDGTSDTNALTTTSVCHADFFHTYAAPGTYFIKQILYNGALAIDSVTFSYEYLYCRTLPIKFYDDMNSNCIFDSGDVYNHLPIRVEVDSNSVPIDTFTITSGIYYQAYGPPGTIYGFRFIPSSVSGVIATCPSSGILYDTIQSIVNNYPTRYLGLECSSSEFDLSTYALFCAGTESAHATIIVNNTFCTSGPSVLTMTFSPKYTYASASRTPTSVIGNIITWDLPSMSYFLTIPPINVYFDSSSVVFGDTINTVYRITPIIGDADTSNNTFTRNDTVYSSYDPNEMSVTPSGIISAGAQLQYTILFENTGNDTAHDIYVMDTLSDNVNTNSFELLAASAVMNIALFNDGVHNILKFDFPNIDLLDSSHHNQCDGMVIFNINAKAGLPNGTTIFNHAGIFFDDNPVVLTNTVEDIIGTPLLNTTAINNTKVEIYPNPTTNVITIKMQQGAYYAYSITNTIGQVELQQQITTAQTNVNVNMLPAGVYYITLRGNNGTTVQKFAKM